jgi:type I restriction enzyme R subunit
MPLGEGEKLKPITEVGGGSVQEKEKARLGEIIEKLNTLFGSDTTDGDQLSWVDCVAVKLKESATLTQQASNNTKEQFANSPDLDNGLMNAIISALDAHNSLSTQALNSESIRNGLKSILLGPARLYETLRAQAVS